MRAPVPSSEAVARRMRNTPIRDTPAELAVRRILHRRGLRYRVDIRPEPSIRRRADVVFTRVKVAVFIDGCFWHLCPEHGRTPKSNAEWWRDKLEANSRRDRDTDDRLRAAGWTVVRVWEHESPSVAADRVVDAVRRQQGDS